MDEFTRAYIECALWSSTDDEGEPLDAVHDSGSIAPDSLATMQADCADFQTNNEALEAAYGQDAIQYYPAQAGHDFWLTRNRHGAGFWDRGLGDIGEKLSEIARPYGPIYLFVGDDEQIHAA